ncbi:MAG: hypothetical protein UR43_C0010G0031 [candidate division TM6 bacterium GW2011_GWF2_33_332]|nr:MAG: hypothetical protein UR43_C0010G0031 [candidate division TM6 bacterium GW2011_GWF2_33_332]
MAWCLFRTNRIGLTEMRTAGLAFAFIGQRVRIESFDKLINFDAGRFPVVIGITVSKAHQRKDRNR